MEKKFKQALLPKVKDMGLSDKAIDELVALGINGLDNNSSDEDIDEKVDSMVPFAKLMQGEVTRKTQKKSPKTAKVDDDADDDGSEMPGWFKSYKAETDKKIAELNSANEQLKAEKAKADRYAIIRAKAKEMNIPEVMVKHLSIPEDADIDATLTEIRQDLVTHSLLPKGSGVETVTTAQAMEADAKAWAETLPDK